VNTDGLEHLRIDRADGAPTDMLSVLKIGGSILRDAGSYAIVAQFLSRRLNEMQAERVVAIVSAQYGLTDALLAEAESIAPGAAATALDLLWSTGELRSVALLSLHLQRLGVDAVPFNVHQTGLVAEQGASVAVRPVRLLAALAHHRLIVVPGFLGVAAGGAVRSLGRGGSDLTAVLLADAIRADRCELIKDVPGYHTSDPNTDPLARPIASLSTAEALDMADAGCDLVQRAALVAAADAALPLIIRSIDDAASCSFVHPRSQHGVLNQDDSLRSAVGA
jgi:aspartate kinase